ncbi:MAG: polysaccharide deacetylase family protein [Drouetiella hepatica Uher 2000/2452]|uniref:Polysaccharide deacetylase family protein n=1 Tax=Drouetiella hepatica Uher 2000/2452 TaxID=904376 RepID=A0A951UL57_9CYAN|nr:polysaccharide deacetylase family protein [Drouetiella hepatica Uher 2000/2452]
MRRLVSQNRPASQRFHLFTQRLLHGRTWRKNGMRLGLFSAIVLLQVTWAKMPLHSTELGAPAELGSPAIGSPAVGSPTEVKTCLPNTQFTTVRSSDQMPLAQTSNMGELLNKLSPALAAQFPVPFPQINGMARLARVPVMMYHDILPEKEVFFDVTPSEFTEALELIRVNGLTPISLDQLTQHLGTGMQLPDKPILLTFDDGYEGHYSFVYPLLKQYGYPGLFAIYPGKVGTGSDVGRSSLTWDQIREMAADPLVTIASHSVTHPEDMTQLADDRLRYEVAESKRILETNLGMTLKYFVYPSGKNDARVQHWVQMTGYKAALTMNDEVDKFAGESENLLSVDRIGQSKLADVIASAYGGAPLPPFGNSLNFRSAIKLDRRTVNEVPLIMVAGGRPTTIHAKSRYQVPEIIANTPAVAAVDGGFFSLESLDSNVMVGPVLSQSTQEFIPSIRQEVGLLVGRPLILISPDQVSFVPFDPAKHNTLEGVQAEMPKVTDAFVGAAWLVRDGQPQPPEAFGRLFDFDASRDRAFWGINYAGQPVVGVSGDFVDSVSLGEALSRAGLRDAVMLDSGASASLAFEGKSMMSYEPRPVPHVVALLPPDPMLADCAIVSEKQDQ